MTVGSSTNLLRPLSSAEKEYLHAGPGSLLFLRMPLYGALALMSFIGLLAEEMAAVAPASILLLVICWNILKKFMRRDRTGWGALTFFGRLHTRTRRYPKSRFSQSLMFPFLHTFVDGVPVSIPVYWARTLLSQNTDMFFRVAPKPGERVGTYFEPYQLLETDSGLSIDWEDANVPMKRPVLNYWLVATIAFSALAGAMMLLTGYILHELFAVGEATDDGTRAIWAGVSCVLVFLMVASAIGRTFLQIREFARQAREAYAKAGINLEL
jgi:hypothetical protein